MVTPPLPVRKLGHIKVSSVSQPVSDGAKFILLTVVSYDL